MGSGDPRVSSWRFWLLWVAASAAGGATVSTLARAVAPAGGPSVPGDLDGPHLGGIAGDERILAVALAALLTGIGTAQWLVIRRRVSWAVRWLLGIAVGGAASGAAIFGVATALGGFDVPTASNTGVATGVVVLGSVNWALLRRKVALAHWLALGAVAGLMGAIVGGGLVGGLVGGHVGAGAGFGAGYGAVTGAAVVGRSRAEAAKRNRAANRADSNGFGRNPLG